MSTKAALLRFRSDTVANLRTVNKFALGEPVYATDAKIFKIGDGTHGWDELKEFGAAAEHYVRTGTVTGNGTQTVVIDVGEEDIKEISFELAATGAFTAPYGGLLSGSYNFKTGSTLLNYVGASTDEQVLIIGSWRDNHLEASKQLVGGHWYVTLHGVTSASAEAEGYAKFYNGLPYRWHAVPLAGEEGVDTEHFAYGYKTMTANASFRVEGIVDQQGNAFTPAGYMFCLAPDVNENTTYTNSVNMLTQCIYDGRNNKMWRNVMYTPAYSCRVNPGVASENVGLGWFEQTAAANAAYNCFGERYFWIAWG